MTYTSSICTDTYGYSKFVIPEYPCPKNAEDRNSTVACCRGPVDTPEKEVDKLLDESRKSFMSGHSSFSFYCATFLVIYLHARLSTDQFRDAKMVKEDTSIPRILLRYIFSLTFKY